MTEKELRKLSRADMLKLLLRQMQRNEELQAELDLAKARLEERRIAIASSGTLAEAALRLNGIFEAADRAAKQYLENLRGENAEGSGEK